MVFSATKLPVIGNPRSWREAKHRKVSLIADHPLRSGSGQEMEKLSKTAAPKGLKSYAEMLRALNTG